MQGRADGDKDVVKGDAKKRGLDDALGIHFGVASSDPKRRHTTARPGHDDDENTSNTSSFRSAMQDIRSNGASKSSRSQLERLLFASSPASSTLPQTHQSWKPPNSTGSAAQASGAPGASGSSRGANAGSLGGVFSGLNRYAFRQIPQANEPSTSSSTSSDASSIPAGSTENLPIIALRPPAHVPETSFQSLRYGHNPADRAAAGEGGPQNQERAGQGARSHNTEQFAVGRQTRQSVAQGRPPRSYSHVEGQSVTPYKLDSSEDDLYVDEDDQDTDEDDDEDPVFFPNNRQGIGRLEARGSNGHVFENHSNGRLDDKHKSGPFVYDETPSGKNYHIFEDKDGQLRFAKCLLFPDGWSLRRVSGLTGLYYFCPKVHKGIRFNDNLDEEGTLEIVGPTQPGASSVVVSQNPRNLPGLVRQPHSFQPTRAEDFVKTEPIESGMGGYEAAPFIEAGQEFSDPQVVDSSASEDGEQDSASKGSSELDLAMAESEVWAYVAPLVPKTWTASVTDGLETRAFIQAISLPLRNKMDKSWLEGTKRSHQRIYRALMSVIFQAIGVEALCKPCESKILERRRNCKVLPPEAEGMQELQEVCGSQCVNCYFFQATKSCEFPSSSTTITTKRTPIPVPTPPVMRPPPNVERSLDPLQAAHNPPPASSRPHVPSYSSYKATKADKPISESPVPIPLFAARGPNSQRRLSHPSDVSSEDPHTETFRRSSRIAKTGGEPSSSNSIRDSDKTEEARSFSAASVASATLNAGPSRAAVATEGFEPGGSSIKESTAATPNLLFSNNPRSQLIGRVFTLFGDISRLPAEEQAILWNQMQQMAGMLQTGGPRKASFTQNTSRSLPPGASAPAAAAEWEIAPGMITVDDRRLALSTSFLSRDVLSLRAAQQLSPTQRVLNKGIAALDQLRVGQEKGWDCTCSIIRGVLKMRVGDVEERIGQGGMIVVEKECIITNISHKEARIQVWWRKADD